MNIEVTAGAVTPTSTGVEGALDVDVTVTLPVARTAELWWAWHDKDSSRASATMGEAEKRCAAWVAGDSDDGPESDTVDIEGEVTLARSEYDGRWSSWGQPDHWVCGTLLEAIRALDLGREQRDVLAAIEVEAAEACDGDEPESAAS